MAGEDLDRGDVTEQDETNLGEATPRGAHGNSCSRRNDGWTDEQTSPHSLTTTHPPITLVTIKKKSTGVVVADDVAGAFTEFKLQRGDFKLRYFIYVIQDKKTVTMEKQGPRESTYDDFVADLPDDDCRYGLIDLDFIAGEGRPTSKLVFISWNPDNASVRAKMLYSGSKEAIKNVLTGVGIHINATDHSELDFETSVLPVLKRFA
jgi:cofilin